MEYTALVSGLVGAVIGAVSSLLGQIVQNGYQNRRESTRLLYESAYKDYELRILHTPQNRAAFPVILDYHRQMMRLLENDELTPDTAAAAIAAQGAMNAAVLRAADGPDGPAPSGES